MLRNWIDKDWERRGYIATFAIVQKLFWVSPLLAIGIIVWLVGAGPGDLLYDWGLSAGALLSLMMFAYSSYRWFLGYGRTSWSEEKARKRRD